MVILFWVYCQTSKAKPHLVRQWTFLLPLLPQASSWKGITSVIPFWVYCQTSRALPHLVRQWAFLPIPPLSKLKSESHKKAQHFVLGFACLQRARDSNPRYREVQQFSRLPRSTTPPALCLSYNS